MRFSPGARACTTQAALHAAIGFIAGFEDDTSQSGVTELLALLRQAAAQPTPSKTTSPDVISLPAHVRGEFIYSGDSINHYDAQGNEDVYYRRRYCPPSWGDIGVTWHPSYWDRHSYRVAHDGRRFSELAVSMVCDDFGFLVPVPEDSALKTRGAA